MAQKIRRYLPKTPTDTCAFIFTIVMIPVILLFELFVVLPALYENKPKTPLYYFHIFAAFFMFVNVMGNIWMTLSTDTSTMGRMLPSILKPGWRFCYVCEANSPPRSFHCHICDRCILRRDHHCTFTGNCIGFYNQRYYLSLIFFMLLAGIYANIMNSEYIWLILGEISLSNVLALLFPLMGWIIGLHGSLSMVASFLTSLCIFGTLLMTGLFFYHFVNVVKGQTVFENSHRVKQYNIGWRKNLENVMGTRWYVAWIFPAISSPIPGNGLEYDLQSTYETPKSM